MGPVGAEEYGGALQAGARRAKSSKILVQVTHKLYRTRQKVG